MANPVFKNLGRSYPAANVLTDVYTVPTGKFAVVHTLFICNHDNTNGHFRVAITPGGGATVDSDYLYFDKEVGPNDTLPVPTAGLALSVGTGEVLRFQSDNGQISISLTGKEEEYPA